MHIHGDFLVLGIARFGHQFAPAERQLLAVQKRHLGVGGDIEGNALQLSLLDARGVVLPARFEAQLGAEEVPDVRAQVTLPLVKALEPGFLSRQFRFFASEGMGVFQLGEKLNGVLDAIDAEVQVIDLPEADPDFRLLGRRVGLTRRDGK